ncbi:MAG TPA: Glu/Leu/Phe/Val dehydrogenase dimerization domain-containing protein [Pyrinomonadaceae bacterium]|nr:Glu/Leu/Phe/Val dehydrogenase dimerization domain-containing protein [Pyrinomonadaceae bacterium]
MEILEKKAGGYEQVVCGRDRAANYRAIIAVHNTTLGPALGGTRLWRYRGVKEALVDALRLARGMTYKNALAGLPLGGGKSVILAPAKITDRAALFRAHGRLVETLKGLYITAEDVATTPADMGCVALETKHVVGLEGRSGDPSPVTAHGVFRAILASAKYRWGSDSVAGKTVALQGCGSVGSRLAKKLHEAGAKLIVTDVDRERVENLIRDFGAEGVVPEDIYDARADIFAPCALGGIINDRTLPRLKVEIVAGAANNQLLEDRHGRALAKRGILYAPDYVANAGGVIHVCIGALSWEPARVAAKVEGIYDTLLDIYRAAEVGGIPTSRAADQLAERRLGLDAGPELKILKVKGGVAAGLPILCPGT